jgi:hypothetical protein
VASPFADVLASLSRAFERAGLRWYLFGAQAAILHGAARLTADVDVTAHLDDAPPEVLVGALLEAGFALRVPDPEFVARTRVLPVIHVASGIPADIVFAGPGLEEMFLARAKRFEIDGVRVPVASARWVAATPIPIPPMPSSRSMRYLFTSTSPTRTTSVASAVCACAT